jgi:phosphoglycolate phosphatase
VRPSAVLFDLDGTLLDTLRDIGESMNAALVELGFPPHPLSAYRRFVGDGVGVLARRSLPPAAADAMTVDRCVAVMRRIYTANADVHTHAYTGIPELLDALHARDIALAVLSNKPQDLTDRVIERYFGAHRFAEVAGARSGVPHKPDPIQALAIAQRMVRRPGEFLYVGDTDTDMRTATAAGMVAVGAAWGFRSVDELSATGASYIAQNPLDVLRVLDEAARRADR